MSDQLSNKRNLEIANDVLVIERIFKAEPGRVFDAFSSAGAISQWFGPEGCQVVKAEVDFKEGGKYRLRISTETGEVELAGVYQTIERPGHLSFSWRWEVNPNGNPCDSFVEVMFHEHPEGTLMRLVQTGIEDDQDRAHHGIGWNSTFDRLGKLMADS